MPTTLTPTDTHESEVLYSQAMELLSRNHVLAALKRFEEALQNTIDWYMSHLEWVNPIQTGDYCKWIEINYEDREAGTESNFSKKS